MLNHRSAYFYDLFGVLAMKTAILTTTQWHNANQNSYLLFTQPCLITQQI
jgi:hypothetical protein